MSTAAHAQASDDPLPRNRISFALALTDGAVRDLAASPLVYSGNGLGLSVAYLRLGERARNTLSLSLARASYGASTPNSKPTEDVADVDLRFTTLRVRRRNWRFGGALSAEVHAREHHYADVNESTDIFGYALASLGAVAATDFHIRANHVLTQQLFVPLVSTGVWPYSNGRSAASSGRVNASWLSLGTLRRLDETLTYRSAYGGTQIVWSYRFALLHADDAMARRRIVQGIEAAVSLPIGHSR